MSANRISLPRTPTSVRLPSASAYYHIQYVSFQQSRTFILLVDCQDYILFTIRAVSNVGPNANLNPLKRRLPRPHQAPRCVYLSAQRSDVYSILSITEPSAAAKYRRFSLASGANRLLSAPLTLLESPHLLLQWPLTRGRQSPRSSHAGTRLGKHWVRGAIRW